MKLGRDTFVRYWDVHAWAGVLVSLVLYMMLLTGGMTLFHEPLELWEEPLNQVSVSRGDALGAADRWLASVQDLPDTARVYLPRGEGHGLASFYAAPPGEESELLFLHAHEPGATAAREHLAHFTYQLHFLWHDLTGRPVYWFAGFIAFVMLVTLITGLLIHLQHLARAFHQFRAHKTRRVLWSDMHKVLGVMGLPFQLLYAFTGAFMVLGPVLLGAFLGPVFGGDRARASEAAFGLAPPVIDDAGERVAVLPLEALVARAQAAAPDLAIDTVVLYRHGHEHALVDVRGLVGQAPTTFGAVRLREVDGEVIDVNAPRTRGASAELVRFVYGVHYAHFGGWGTRLVLFLLALAACGTVLTGNAVWLARRDPLGQRVGNRVLARLSAGVGAGVWAALGVIFVVSRALPLDLPGRGGVEELSFLGALTLCVIAALCTEDARRTWAVQLGVAAVCFALAPVLAPLRSGAGVLGGGVRLPYVVAVDCGLWLTAVVCGAGAFALRRRARVARALATPDTELEVAT
ncbi:MAG: PepSY-associated TM helix domain-containing protein [Polyangiales bacterium]